MSETSAVVEKSLRSVFVGNIPYEATEEKLRDIFSQVGPVLSFKLMYDRESGKPKGYGFCEYKDQETALSAMRNLNGFEIGGRPLRVDNACTEKSRMEMQSLMMGPIVESPFGPEVEPEKAPEAISNAVASLPPEQMYELMRQMKLCVRNNPAEARTMLMNNPQLAYALLQAQVVMRIIDPKTAVQILHGSREPAEPVIPSTGSAGPIMNGGTVIPPSNPPISSNMPTHYPPPQQPAPQPGPPTGPPAQLGPPRMGGPIPTSGPPIGGPPGVPFQPTPQPVPLPNRGPPFPGGDYDLRQLGGGPRGPGPQVGDQDMRMPPVHAPPNMPHDNYGLPPAHDFEGSIPLGDGGDIRYPREYDSRMRDGPNAPLRDSRDQYSRDPRDNRDSRPMRDPRDPRDRDYRNNLPPVDNRDPRGMNFPNQDKDFRSREQMPSGNPVNPSQSAPPQRSLPPAGPNSALPPGLAGQDQEKASLIMQVLQLSEEQIRMLPPEQQASILQLKEQIQRSTH